MADPAQQRAQLAAAIAKTGWRGSAMPPPMPGPTSRRLSYQDEQDELLAMARGVDPEIRLSPQERDLMAAQERTEMARAEIGRRAMMLPGGAGPILAGVGQFAPMELADPTTARAVMQGGADRLQSLRDAGQNIAAGIGSTVNDMGASLGFAGPSLGRAAAMRPPASVPNLPMLEFRPPVEDIAAGLNRAPAMLESAGRAAPSVARDVLRNAPSVARDVGAAIPGFVAEMSGAPGLGRMRDQFGVMQQEAYLGAPEDAFDAGMAGLGEGVLAGASGLGTAMLADEAIRLGGAAMRARPAMSAPLMDVPPPRPDYVPSGTAIPPLSRAELEAVQGYSPRLPIMRNAMPSTAAQQANDVIAARSGARTPAATQEQIANAPAVAAMIRRQLGMDVPAEVVETAPEVAMAVRPAAANQSAGSFRPQAAGLRPTAPRQSMSIDEDIAAPAPPREMVAIDRAAMLRNLAGLADEATAPSALPARASDSTNWDVAGRFFDDLMRRNRERAPIAPPMSDPMAMRPGQFPRDVVGGTKTLVGAIDEIARGMPARPGQLRVLSSNQMVDEAAQYGYAGNDPREAGAFLRRQTGGRPQAMRRDPSGGNILDGGASPYEQLKDPVNSLYQGVDQRDLKALAQALDLGVDPAANKKALARRLADALSDPETLAKARSMGFGKVQPPPSQAGTFADVDGSLTMGQAENIPKTPPSLELRTARIAERRTDRYMPPPGMPKYMRKPAELAKNGFSLEEIAEENDLALDSARAILARARKLDPTIPRIRPRVAGDSSKLNWSGLRKEIDRARSSGGERLSTERVGQVLGVANANSLKSVISQARKGAYGPEVQEFARDLKSARGIPGGYGAAALSATGAGAAMMDDEVYN